MKPIYIVYMLRSFFLSFFFISRTKKKTENFSCLNKKREAHFSGRATLFLLVFIFFSLSSFAFVSFFFFFFSFSESDKNLINYVNYPSLRIYMHIYIVLCVIHTHTQSSHQFFFVPSII